MSKYILDNLFGSKVRVKLLKFLYRNYPGEFNIKELSHRTQEESYLIKKEMANLLSMGLIKIKK